jgi:hypothetical protein
MSKLMWSPEGIEITVQTDEEEAEKKSAGYLNYAPGTPPPVVVEGDLPSESEPPTYGAADDDTGEGPTEGAADDENYVKKNKKKK